MTLNASVNAFVYACKEYLSKLDIGQLRAYGRHVGVLNPTEMNKEPLIDSIVRILIGESKPTKRSGRGAPVKNNCINAEIIEKIASLKELHAPNAPMGEGIYFTVAPNDGKVVFVQSSSESPLKSTFSRPVYRGQVTTQKGVTYLAPAKGDDSFEKLVICVELIRQYGLREGDTVSCYAKHEQGKFVATQILTINEKLVDESSSRLRFEDARVIKPIKKLFTESLNSVTDKYFSWILPIAKGQRGLVYSPPKAGKSRLLLDIAKTAARQPNLQTYAILVEQPPEAYSAFLSVLPSDNTFFSSYADDAEKHVFNADFLLKRAKRLAEAGEDVLILVDSFSALMRAYNETENSDGGKRLPCGIESKTLYYVKNYLGSARAFEKKGSLTIIGTVSSQTGDPMDDALTAELKLVANLQISLSRQLSMQRIFPAVDLFESQSDNYEEILSSKEREAEAIVREKFLENGAAKRIVFALEQSKTADELKSALEK